MQSCKIHILALQKAIRWQSNQVSGEKIMHAFL